VLGVTDDTSGTVEDRLEAADLTRVLTRRERLVVDLRFGHDLTQRAIGEIAGSRQMQVSRILDHALEKMRKAERGRLRASRH
jgi:RNA polymerase sigma-B factor